MASIITRTTIPVSSNTRPQQVRGLDLTRGLLRYGYLLSFFRNNLLAL